MKKSTIFLSGSAVLLTIVLAASWLGNSENYQGRFTKTKNPKPVVDVSTTVATIGKVHNPYQEISAAYYSDSEYNLVGMWWLSYDKSTPCDELSFVYDAGGPNKELADVYQDTVMVVWSGTYMTSNSVAKYVDVTTSDTVAWSGSMDAFKVSDLGLEGGKSYTVGLYALLPEEAPVYNIGEIFLTEMCAETSDGKTYVWSPTDTTSHNKNFSYQRDADEYDAYYDGVSGGLLMTIE